MIDNTILKARSRTFKAHKSANLIEVGFQVRPLLFGQIFRHNEVTRIHLSKYYDMPNRHDPQVDKVISPISSMKPLAEYFVAELLGNLAKERDFCQDM